MSFNDLNMFWDHYVKDTTDSGNISYWNGCTSKRKAHVLTLECILNHEHGVWEEFEYTHNKIKTQTRLNVGNQNRNSLLFTTKEDSKEER